MPTSTVPRSSLALRRIALFEGLADTCLERLAGECDWRTVDARTPVFTRNSDGGEVFFLVAGRARITTYSPQGREVSFRDCEAGEHFGDLSAIDDAPRSADVVTLESSVLASLRPQAFIALLQREPMVAMRILRDLAAKVRGLTERVIELSTLGVQTRLHAELLRLAHAAGVSDNQARIDPAPPHAALASKISTNREQVTRELNALAKSGLLRKDGAHALVVTDVRRLDTLVADVRGA
ncbi:Crp/Fnr family transcriptional regulator [Paenacidovorax monticola]|uniref:Crp/Fnr family transcriptional regulator n=1 Tax=Paenacidovorax monticola TaxID=1926868 RepID=A0A7H0HDK7_9BURK|nr:Crp/Fnr family transcriptional regulator [Paenacidovorax monticola]QNP58623.1 Crp/Fnr family transcriptional regulator [Paenacidovorax monticola]